MPSSRGTEDAGGRRAAIGSQADEGDHMTKSIKKGKIGSPLDDFLKKDGIL